MKVQAINNDNQSFKALKITPEAKAIIEKQTGGVERDPRWWVDKFLYVVDDYVGKKTKTITFHPHYKFKINGDGDTIIAQSPEAGEKIVQDGYVILYTN